MKTPKSPKAAARKAGEATPPMYGGNAPSIGKGIIDSMKSSQSAGGPPIPSFHRGTTNLAIFGGDPAKVKKTGKGG